MHADPFGSLRWRGTCGPLGREPNGVRAPDHAMRYSNYGQGRGPHGDFASRRSFPGTIHGARVDCQLTGRAGCRSLHVPLDRLSRKQGSFSLVVVVVDDGSGADAVRAIRSRHAAIGLSGRAVSQSRLCGCLQRWHPSMPAISGPTTSGCSTTTSRWSRPPWSCSSDPSGPARLGRRCSRDRRSETAAPRAGGRGDAWAHAGTRRHLMAGRAQADLPAAPYPVQAVEGAAPLLRLSAIDSDRPARRGIWHVLGGH